MQLLCACSVTVVESCYDSWISYQLYQWYWLSALYICKQDDFLDAIIYKIVQKDRNYGLFILLEKIFTNCSDIVFRLLMCCLLACKTYVHNMSHEQASSSSTELQGRVNHLRLVYQ